MILQFGYDYASCIQRSERVAWRVDDLMPEGTRLSLDRPLLPRSLAAAPVPCLNARESLVLNQLAGNAYLNLFAFVEEFIVATVVRHAHAELFGDHDAIRALVRFADEEIKHQRLFERYRTAFDAAFGHRAEVLGTAAEVAGTVLGKSPIGVMLIILHLELMTQDHFTESVKDDTSIDPFFVQLLEKHWLEESQHARIDALELAKLVNAGTPAQVEQGVQDYIELLGTFDALLEEQAAMDARTLSVAVGRVFTEEERGQIEAAQLLGYRRTFLVAGIANRQFGEVLLKLSAARSAEVQALARAWSAPPPT